MDKELLQLLGQQMLDAVKAYVARALAPLVPRIEALERRPAEPITLPERMAFQPLPRGQDGRDGRDGKDGAPGRDAFELDPLPAIDETKSYPRGTVALHRGGTVRAFRATAPLAGGEALEPAGWAVLMEGICGYAEEHHDGGREVERTVTFTSGRKQVERRVTVAPVYRFTWNDAAEYRQGDMVQRDGSVWICVEPLTKSVPRSEGDKAWRLMVKTGKQGAPGIPGKDGAKGADGRPGRDLTQMTADGRRY